MKIVIDIHEEDYLNLIKIDENGEKEIPLSLLMSLWDNVKYNCTPLPKTHGRLMILSEDKLKENLMDLSFSCQKWISEVDLSNATVAIIESESEDKNEDCN